MVDGPPHVKRRHHDNPLRSSKHKTRGGPSDRSNLQAGVASTSSCSSSRSTLEDPSNGGLSPIAGPSGFKPKHRANKVLKPSGPSNREGSDEDAEAYNSDDEYERIRDKNLSEREWQEREERFAELLKKINLVIKQMEQDGACLFRAVADQVYGDQEMHGVVRQHCMDYIVSQINQSQFENSTAR